MKHVWSLIFSYVFVLLIFISPLVSYMYAKGSPLNLMFYPWLILIIISYVSFFVYNLTREDKTYLKLISNWFVSSLVFTIGYIIVHEISLVLFQMVNYRWYSDMVGAELIFIVLGMIAVNILLLVIRFLKKALNFKI